MKYVAVLFLGYEVYKLLTIKQSLKFFLSLRDNKLLIGESYHLWVNLAYLAFVIVLMFYYPWFAIGIILLSGLVWFLERSKSNTVFSIAFVGDSITSVSILTLFILKG